MRWLISLIAVASLGLAFGMVSSDPTDELSGGNGPRGHGFSTRGSSIPRSMAAIGDSITQAANVGFGSGDWAVEHSWATGRSTEDPVLSHLERLWRTGSRGEAVAHNLSVSGARMQDARRQAQMAVSLGAEYVTFLMGANDACASSRFSMTSVRSFRRDFERALHALVTGLPETIVYVVSIPDVYRLWEVMSDDSQARESWRIFGTCGALLDERNTEGDRLRVRERVRQFNELLEEVCERYGRCHHDGGAVFRYPFPPEDVSPLDFFHPSIAGQSHLAEVTWRHGPFTGPNGTVAP